MNCFEECTQLRKLYLEANRISRLEGLNNCQRLEELYLGDQNIGNLEFTFDEYSLASISNTLEVLDLPKVNLIHCKPLYDSKPFFAKIFSRMIEAFEDLWSYFLENLITLNLNDNFISDFNDGVAPMLMTLIRLTQLTMLRNPVVRQTPKYRDQVVSLTGPQFTELDGKTIKIQER